MSDHSLLTEKLSEALPDNLTQKATPSTNSSNTEVFRVPNIVHYIWYNDKTVDLRFDQALSLLSAVKYIRPETIYLHTNNKPNGENYDMIKSVPVLKVRIFFFFFALVIILYPSSMSRDCLLTN